MEQIEEAKDKDDGKCSLNFKSHQRTLTQTNQVHKTAQVSIPIKRGFRYRIKEIFMVHTTNSRRALNGRIIWD